MNNILIFFPLGAGGNLLKNIITLDTKFEFFDDSPFFKEYTTTESRFEFLRDFYKKPVTSESWLTREWSIRTASQVRYYENNTISYWNPDCKLVYLVHGELEEMYNILMDKKLTHYDKTGLMLGTTAQKESPKGLQSCIHVFLMPNNIDFITKIYACKNGSLNQFDQNKTADDRFKLARSHNINLNNRLEDYRKFIHNKSNRCLDVVAEELFKDSGKDLLTDLMYRLNVNVPDEMIHEIHSTWLQSTRELYYTSYKEELTL